TLSATPTRFTNATRTYTLHAGRRRTSAEATATRSKKPAAKVAIQTRRSGKWRDSKMVFRTRQRRKTANPSGARSATRRTTSASYGPTPRSRRAAGIPRPRCLALPAPGCPGKDRHHGERRSEPHSALTAARPRVVEGRVIRGSGGGALVAHASRALPLDARRPERRPPPPARGRGAPAGGL